MRTINELIIHTTATPKGWMQGKSVADKVKEITRWHKLRKFRTIGYHRIIDRDGKIGMGRPYAEQGAHVKGHNAHSIGVSLVGGKGGKRNDKFSDHYTEAQRETLNRLIADVRSDFGKGIKISGHNEYSSKACPCFNVPEYLDEMKPKSPLAAFLAALAKMLGGKT